MIIFLLLLVLVGNSVASKPKTSSKLASDITSAYYEVLDRPEVINASILKKLMNIIDDDAYCSQWCEQYLSNLIKKHNHGNEEAPFGLFATIIDAIYGDLISDDPFEPQEIHLSLTGKPSEMTVMWLTAQPLTTPLVEYRVPDCDDDGVWRTSEAVTSTYTVPQKWWPIFTGTIYTSTMIDLPLEKTVEYRVKGYDNNTSERMSNNFIFKSAPENRAERVTRIATLADQGTFMLLGFAAQAKLEEMKDELQIDISTVIGDLSYAGLSSAFPPLNIDKEDEFERIWDLYGVQSQAVASTMPWMVTNGNHERFYDFSAFRYRYTMPWKNSNGSPDNFWYSYTYGNIHWISISSEHDLTDGSVQKIWLENDLIQANLDRETAPWIALAIHKPLYCSAEGTPGGYADLLEDLTYKYNVDILLVGHMHAYERIHPVYQGNVTCLPRNLLNDNEINEYHCKNNNEKINDKTHGRGPVLVVQGNAGGMQAERWVHPQPLWSAKRWSNGIIPPSHLPHRPINSVNGNGPLDLDHEYSDTFGFGLVSALNKTHLHYQSYAVSGDWAVDEFYIVK